MREAQVLAYVLLTSGWPALTVEAHLSQFQTGQDVGENSPFFLGAKILVREPKGERFSLTSKLALGVKVFQLAELGIKATQKARLTEAMREFPNPAFPSSTPASA